MTTRFAYHDVLASISRRRSPLIPEYYNGGTWSTNPDCSTAFLACVDTILSSVARLSALFNEPDKTSLAESTNAAAAHELASQLRAWDLPPTVPSDMRNTSEAMRHAALLFYTKNMYPGLADEKPEALNDEKKLAKQDALNSTQEILKFVAKVPIGSAPVASHVWPLYMAGYFTDVSAEEDFIRERLVKMKDTRGIKSVDRVRERLEMIWDKGRLVDEEREAVILF